MCVGGTLREDPGKGFDRRRLRWQKDIFTVDLEVAMPSVPLYITALKAEAQKKTQTRTSKLKDIMVLISQLSVKSENLKDVLKLAIFSIKKSSGVVHLHTAAANFAILNTLAHKSAFEGKVAALDFSLEDVRDTKVFLLASELEKRFSSETVKDITEPKASELDQDLSRNLRLKAKAIVRYV